MAITVLQEERIFKIVTESSSYVLGVLGNNVLVHLYYGGGVEDAHLAHPGAAAGPRLVAGPFRRTRRTTSPRTSCPLEYSGAGARTCAPRPLRRRARRATTSQTCAYDSLRSAARQARPSGPAARLPQTRRRGRDAAHHPARRGQEPLRGPLLRDVRLLGRDLPLGRRAQRGRAGADPHPRDERLPLLPGDGLRPDPPARRLGAGVPHGAQPHPPRGDGDLLLPRGVLAPAQPVCGAGLQGRDRNPGRGLRREPRLLGNFRIETEVDAFDALRLNCGINDRGFACAWRPGSASARRRPCSSTRARA